MKLSTKHLGGILGAAVFAVGGVTLFGAQGCGDNPTEGLTECIPSCPTDGVAKGNFAITGDVAIDGFFKSVVNFKNVASGVAADIRAEIKGIQLDFGISDAELKAAGNIGAALKAKLNAKATLKVDAQPAKCEVDAQLSVQASAQCEANARCTVDPGKATVQCMGKCTAEVEAGASCEGNLSCEASGPSIECKGSCEGSCTAQLDVAASCEGTCTGTCEGTCAGDTDNGATCKGQCDGMCKGSCELSGSASASCTGSCNGTCKGEPPMAGCSGKLSCEAMLTAMAECKGSCEGEFEPPKVDCDASASCEASAKADAKFSAKCTPPSVKIDFSFAANVDAAAKAQLQFGIDNLKLRLPRLLAAIKKANLVVDAGGELTGAGKDAVKGTLEGLADGEISAVAAFRIGQCAPSQLDASAAAITASGGELQAQISAAASVTKELGLGG
jgi:hypothetical protein